MSRDYGDEFDDMLRYFNYGHLPEHLQSISSMFYNTAYSLRHLPDSAEKVAGLRKLLEAKDCFVRANLQ